MRPLAVVLPAERYFADTAAKMSPCRTLTLDIRVVLFAHGPSLGVKG